MSLFGRPVRKRRKTQEQKQREKGRSSYRKGENFEKKVYPFLTRKGFKVTKSRVRSRKREEFDGLATDKSGRTYGVEVKNTKQKVGATVVRNLRKKVDGNRLLRGGIVVSRSGFTDSALEEAKSSHIKTIKYKQRRVKKRGLFW